MLIWDAAINAFRAHPVTGIGVYGYPYSSKRYSTVPLPLYRAFVEGNSPHETFIARSEEHTSELQSHHDLVCRLLLEKKKKHTHKHVPDLLNDAPLPPATCLAQAPRAAIQTPPPHLTRHAPSVGTAFALFAADGL